MFSDAKWTQDYKQARLTPSHCSLATHTRWIKQEHFFDATTRHASVLPLTGQGLAFLLFLLPICPTPWTNLPFHPSNPPSQVTFGWLCFREKSSVFTPIHWCCKRRNWMWVEEKGRWKCERNIPKITLSPLSHPFQQWAMPLLSS